MNRVLRCVQRVEATTPCNAHKSTKMTKERHIYSLIKLEARTEHRGKVLYWRMVPESEVVIKKPETKWTEGRSIINRASEVK